MSDWKRVPFRAFSVLAMSRPGKRTEEAASLMETSSGVYPQLQNIVQSVLNATVEHAETKPDANWIDRHPKYNGRPGLASRCRGSCPVAVAWCTLLYEEGSTTIGGSQSPKNEKAAFPPAGPVASLNSHTHCPCTPQAHPLSASKALLSTWLLRNCPGWKTRWYLRKAGSIGTACPP